MLPVQIMIRLYRTCILIFNSLPNDKILDGSKLKYLEMKKCYVTELLNFVLGTLEKIDGKGENAGYQHFLLFLNCFKKALFLVSLKDRIVWERVNSLPPRNPNYF